MRLENKGFAKFKPQKANGPKEIELDIGTLTLDKKVANKVNSVFNRFNDRKVFGDKAMTTQGDAVALILEEFVYNASKKKKA